MRRGSHDMQVNVAGIRRNLKNFAHNYSDAQKKVREATSNDPWGPSSTIMAEVADLTYNVVAFSEIMQMIWKRLNDHGRNWRHVYKALVLLDYLIKTGSEKVGQQCKENIFAIQTLKDFQYLEEGKDQGQNVREKAKQLVNLLKDDERLKNERARALKAKERFAQSASGFGSDGGLDTPTSPKYPAFRGDWNSKDSTDLPRDIEIARPQTAGEEELQLQLALAMSREEAEQEEQKRKSDDVRLQLALSQSQQDFKSTQEKPSNAMVDLLDINLADLPATDPWGISQPQQTSPWKAPSLMSPHEQSRNVDPWTPAAAGQQPDLWTAPTNLHTSPMPLSHGTSAKHDPWSPASQSSSTDLDEFDVITNRNKSTSPKANGTNDSTTNDPFELNLLGDALSLGEPEPATSATKKTPLSFLGENSSLVNLDNLVTSKVANPSSTANPFSNASTTTPSRPVFHPTVNKPSINEIKQQPFIPFNPPGGSFSSVPVGQSPYNVNSQFSSTGIVNQESGSIPPTQDPWTPANRNVATNLNSSWAQNNESPNPFLS
ncbi:epsin-2-like [Anoplophora glabripennis]|uniref:epsin-2-like n=1 Tax=Anoplophora glabripennis TaxID=217634 RepID=UPI000C790799|nr:epsin-2-like [Anoplophora glabripennis]XP_023312040.1 epsin-2-like [Anoplophora glabripennis]